LIRHLPKAAFIAIDEEMTGISVTSGRPKRDQRPCEKFPDLKEAADTYNIIQLGVALFTPVGAEDEIKEDVKDKVEASPAAVVASQPARGYEDVVGKDTVVQRDDCLYVVRRYNFYTFPAAPVGWNHEKKGRDIIMDPASVAFLKQHNMSFDTWTGCGVTYTTTDTAKSILETFVAKQTAPPKNQEKARSAVELRRPDDISFFARTMVSFRFLLVVCLLLVGYWLLLFFSGLWYIISHYSFCHYFLSTGWFARMAGYGHCHGRPGQRRGRSRRFGRRTSISLAALQCLFAQGPVSAH
jgi:CAF1 family ribonuclease